MKARSAKMTAKELVRILYRKGFPIDPEFISYLSEYRAKQFLLAIEPKHMYTVLFSSPHEDDEQNGVKEWKAAKEEGYVEKYEETGMGFVNWILHGMYFHNIYLPLNS